MTKAKHVSADSSSVTMELTNYLPFRCIIFVSDSTLIVAVRRHTTFDLKSIVRFQGHEYSPMIYNYDERKGTIEFVEKLDQPEAPTGKLAAGLDCWPRPSSSPSILLCLPWI